MRVRGDRSVSDWWRLLAQVSQKPDETAAEATLVRRVERLDEQRRVSFGAWLSELTEQARRAGAQHTDFVECAAGVLTLAATKGFDGVALLLQGHTVELVADPAVKEALSSVDLAPPDYWPSFRAWDIVAQTRADISRVPDVVATWQRLPLPDRQLIAACLHPVVDAVAQALTRYEEERARWEWAQFGSAEARMNLEDPSDRRLVAAGLVTRGRAECQGIIDPETPLFGYASGDFRRCAPILEFIEQYGAAPWPLESSLSGPIFQERRDKHARMWLSAGAFTITDENDVRPRPSAYINSVSTATIAMAADPYFESWWKHMKTRPLRLLIAYQPVDPAETHPYVMDNTMYEFHEIPDRHLAEASAAELPRLARADVGKALTQVARTRLIDPPPLWRIGCATTADG